MKAKIALLRLLRRQLHQQKSWSSIGNFDRANQYFPLLENTVASLKKDSAQTHTQTCHKDQSIMGDLNQECIDLNQEIEEAFLLEQKLLGREITQLQLERELKRLRSGK